MAKGIRVIELESEGRKLIKALAKSGRAMEAFLAELPVVTAPVEAHEATMKELRNKLIASLSATDKIMKRFGLVQYDRPRQIGGGIYRKC